MARILFINSVCNGSTGTICKNLYKGAQDKGHACCIAYGRGEAPKGFNTIKIGNQLDVYLHVLKARLFDAMGFGSKKATKKLIKEIEKFKPDVIHLHNIHGYYVNIEILFNYLKSHPEIKKVWTLHDCWAYTGHCAYYTYAKCDKWEKECNGKCPNKKEYPKSILSKVTTNYIKKKSILCGVKNMTLVTPSKWLAKEVNKSFLKQYKCIVINNGVDTNVFKPTPSNIKEKYKIEDKKVILGVASVWEKRKGLEIFIELSKELDKQYQIVLIGLTKRQIKNLSNNILGINRTENIQELVNWYSAAYVFINPSLEETFGMTTVEALCCSTSVIVANSAASPEIVGKRGIVLSTLDKQTLKKSILKIKKTNSNNVHLLSDKNSYEDYNNVYKLEMEKRI